MSSNKQITFQLISLQEVLVSGSFTAFTENLKQKLKVKNRIFLIFFSNIEDITFLMSKAG